MRRWLIDALDAEMVSWDTLHSWHANSIAVWRNKRVFLTPLSLAVLNNRSDNNIQAIAANLAEVNPVFKGTKWIPNG